MITEPVSSPSGGPGGGRPWIRPVALVAACLVIGFVGGWIVRGDDGPVTVLAPAESADPGEGADAGAATGTGASTAPAPAATTPAAPTPPPPRSDIQLAVLNGTSQSGLAATTAGRAESLGYAGVATGNAPGQSGPTVVYFRSGQRPAAVRVSRDLQFDAIRRFPGGGALGDEVPRTADVIVVLGPG